MLSLRLLTKTCQTQLMATIHDRHTLGLLPALIYGHRLQALRCYIRAARRCKTTVSKQRRSWRSSNAVNRLRSAASAVQVDQQPMSRQMGQAPHSTTMGSARLWWRMKFILPYHSLYIYIYMFIYLHLFHNLYFFRIFIWLDTLHMFKCIIFV